MTPVSLDEAVFTFETFPNKLPSDFEYDILFLSLYKTINHHIAVMIYYKPVNFTGNVWDLLRPAVSVFHPEPKSFAALVFFSRLSADSLSAKKSRWIVAKLRQISALHKARSTKGSQSNENKRLLCVSVCSFKFCAGAGVVLWFIFIPSLPRSCDKWESFACMQGSF